MSLKVRARVRGERVVTRNLRQLAESLEGRPLAESLLQAAEVFAKRMRDRAPVRRGNLRRSIYSFNAYRSNNPGGRGTRQVRIKLRPNEAMAVASSPLAKLIEFGTKPHVIRPKKKTSLRLLGGVYVPEVNHPGTRARPFWRPVFQEARVEAIGAVDSFVHERVQRHS